MKEYGLCKLDADMFDHELRVGEIIRDDNWDAGEDYPGRIRLLPNASGEYDELSGQYWAVVEYDKDSIVMFNGEIGKVPCGKLLYFSENPDGLLSFFKDVQFDGGDAYFWALYIGDREYMKRFINKATWAYFWALYIGDREYMKQFIKEPSWAYFWALYIGDREYMKQFINVPEWAYKWTLYIGDREYMKRYTVGTIWEKL